MQRTSRLADVDRVKSEPVDQVHCDAHCESVIADRGHRDVVGRAGSLWVLIEFMTAEPIQALHDSGAREVCLQDGA